MAREPRGRPAFKSHFCLGQAVRLCWCFEFLKIKSLEDFFPSSVEEIAFHPLWGGDFDL